MALRIEVKTIPHASHRYETVGDWEWDEHSELAKLQGECLIVSVSEMGDWRKEAAVAVHEIVEALICKANGVDEQSVTNFDVEFEAKREADNVEEPGDDPKAPYRDEHCFATAVERMLCAALQMSWKEYEEAIFSV